MQDRDLARVPQRGLSNTKIERARSWVLKRSPQCLPICSCCLVLRVKEMMSLARVVSGRLGGLRTGMGNTK